MSRFSLLALVGTLVAGGLIAVSVVDWTAESPKEQADSAGSSRDHGEDVYWLDEPVVLTEVQANVRELERSRRAQRPSDQDRKIAYDEVAKGWDDKRPRSNTPAERMPPTSCRSVVPAPSHGHWASGPQRVHEDTFWDFVTASGFGVYRMGLAVNARGKVVASEGIDRVELVSLLTDDEPSVYILDEMATPPIARESKRRPLDEFERLGLDAVRRGENLVWTREAPTRMFGAIRALRQCLDCHPGAKRGDLLGAFTYYLEKPVDQLGR